MKVRQFWQTKYSKLCRATVPISNKFVHFVDKNTPIFFPFLFLKHQKSLKRVAFREKIGRYKINKMSTTLNTKCWMQCIISNQNTYIISNKYLGHNVSKYHKLSFLGKDPNSSSLTLKTWNLNCDWDESGVNILTVSNWTLQVTFLLNLHFLFSKTDAASFFNSIIFCFFFVLSLWDCRETVTGIEMGTRIVV